MSHLTRVKTKLVDLDMLKLALADLDCQYEEGQNLKVAEVTSPILMKILFPGASKHVALIRDKDGTCSLAGDATVMGNLNREGQIAQLSQRYAYHTVKSTLLKQGFLMDEETVGAKNEIRMTLRRMD